MRGEHFIFQLIMFFVVVGGFTVVSLVPLMGRPNRIEEETEDE